MLWTQPDAGPETQRVLPDEPGRLTMVVLSAAGEIDEVEADFYRDAEFRMLSESKAAGLIVLAFCAAERDELILFSAEPVERVATLVAELPFVAVGLARSAISEVRIEHLVVAPDRR